MTIVGYRLVLPLLQSTFPRPPSVHCLESMWRAPFHQRQKLEVGGIIPMHLDTVAIKLPGARS